MHTGDVARGIRARAHQRGRQTGGPHRQRRRHARRRCVSSSLVFAIWTRTHSCRSTGQLMDGSTWRGWVCVGGRRRFGDRRDAGYTSLSTPSTRGRPATAPASGQLTEESACERRCTSETTGASPLWTQPASQRWPSKASAVKEADLLLRRWTDVERGHSVVASSAIRRLGADELDAREKRLSVFREGRGDVQRLWDHRSRSTWTGTHRVCSGFAAVEVMRSFCVCSRFGILLALRLSLGRGVDCSRTTDKNKTQTLDFPVSAFKPFTKRLASTVSPGDGTHGSRSRRPHDANCMKVGESICGVRTSEMA